MTANLIRIGNSRGIILPAAMLKEMNLHEETVFEITLREDGIVLSPRKAFTGNFTGPFSALNVPGKETLWGSMEDDASVVADDLRNGTHRNTEEW